MADLSPAMARPIGAGARVDAHDDPRLCASCDADIGNAYYTINGRRVCQGCQRRMRGSATMGIGLGAAATFASIGLYYGILEVFGVRFLLIAVLAGVGIGAAVRRGAGYGGGSLCRVISLVLTYVAVVTTYVHSVLALSDGHTLLSAWVSALSLPFRMAAEGKNLVSLALLGLGLHEAWQFSRAPVVHEEGPLQVTSDAATADTR